MPLYDGTNIYDQIARIRQEGGGAPQMQQQVRVVTSENVVVSRTEVQNRNIRGELEQSFGGQQHRQSSG